MTMHKKQSSNFYLNRKHKKIKTSREYKSTLPEGMTDENLREAYGKVVWCKFTDCKYNTQIEKEDGKDIGLSALINRRSEDTKKPLLYDKDKKPLELIEELPNGSNVKVKYKCWTYTHPYTGEVRKGCDLIAVMLLDETPSIF